MINPKLTLFGLLLAFQWRISVGIDCYQQAPTSVTSATAYNVFTCPGSISQCYKYVCVGEVYFIQKGCLDPHSPTQNCQVTQNQCHGQSGTGACYVCSGNRCNSAHGKTKFGGILLIPIGLGFSFVMTKFYRNFSVFPLSTII